MYNFSQPIVKYVAERDAYSVSFLVNGTRLNVGEIERASSFGPSRFVPNIDSPIAESAREAVAKFLATEALK